MSSKDFVPGLELGRGYFSEVVEPIVNRVAPGEPIAAGLIGAGSDVLGYDTARSMDHDWGPRVILWFAGDDDLERHGSSILAALDRALPPVYRGFATRYGIHDDGTKAPGSNSSDGPHAITVTSARRWFCGGDRSDPATATWIRLPGSVLDAAIAGEEPKIDPVTWVTLPTQWLLECTAGAIFRDDAGAITRLREALAWYPDDVWRYLMAVQWKRISQLEAFIGRCGEVGDDLGSHLVAMDLVRDLMGLAFLQERRYAPYAKWFGTGFSQLKAASVLTPHLNLARFATSWQEREAGIVAAGQWLAERHNAMGLTDWIDPAPRPFHNRPFSVLFAERFSDALMESITDEAVLALPRNIGNLDQFIDSTDAMNRGDLQRAIGEWMRTT